MLSFLFPPTCHLCGRTLPPDTADHRHLLCSACLKSLPRTQYYRTPDNRMEERFAGLFPFDRAAGHFFYRAEAELSIIMQDLKYRRFRQLARYMGEVMGNELMTSDFLNDVDFIVPVPMYFLKKARRGYNQTEEIAAGLSSVTGIPVSTSLRACRPHKTQTKLTPDERRQNLEHVFTLKANHDLANRKIILLDDVCTTGTTLTAAAQSIIDTSPSTRLSLLTLGVTF
ncbi:MAG: hypothetical protein K2J03_03210 [Muribaculaceae bacterium]|nr:hypothetical protein [Muribaculaceae bacterium]